MSPTREWTSHDLGCAGQVGAGSTLAPPPRGFGATTAKYLSLIIAVIVVLVPLGDIPSVTTQVATFQIVNYLGLFDGRWAAVVLYMGTDIIAVYIFVQFIRAIPISPDESARIDGANSFTICWRITMPLLKPAIATVVIVKGIAVCNDFCIPVL